MKYRDPRQIIDKKIFDFCSFKMKKERIFSSRLLKTNLKEMAIVSEQIEEMGLPARFVLKKLPKKLGRGIFLHPEAAPILKGELIAPYSGEVSLVAQSEDNDSDYIFGLLSDLTLTKEEQQFFDPDRCYHPRRLYCLDLDARKRGNFTRFINHSSKPNVEADLFHIPKNSFGLAPAPCEILYIAKKTIRPGEQLLVCYEGTDKSYWGPLKIKPFLMTPKTFRLNRKLKVVQEV